MPFRISSHDESLMSSCHLGCRQWAQIWLKARTQISHPFCLILNHFYGDGDRNAQKSGKSNKPSQLLENYIKLQTSAKTCLLIPHQLFLLLLFLKLPASARIFDHFHKSCGP